MDIQNVGLNGKDMDSMDSMKSMLLVKHAALKEAKEAYDYLARLFESEWPDCKASPSFPVLATQLDNGIALLKSKITQKHIYSNLLYLQQQIDDLSGCVKNLIDEGKHIKKPDFVYTKEQSLKVLSKYGIEI